ncbi:glycosyltransferase family 2 protein [Mucilaginibacter ginsenosidivorans]|uniref:Glycosyltransferase n=1 Tax=Mucilaginibacter ginsenosidivorans TaxID=398053 RepID=A0A5B8UUE6_9SPHI|nr:glycosyltransferase [Mucilaginibacter ginsenosidivorans]QEC62563.1 glycosyltransferase [Mucilaginibacter ginsenosidivorans]
MDKAIDQQPLVSVIMPVYNSAPYLREAVESILNQSYRHFEFLIFNDGSTDESGAILASYRDERIKLTDCGENKGYIHWLNEGIKNAKGVYIARMDSDDVALAGRLEKQVSYLQEHAAIGLCGCRVQPIRDGLLGKIWDYPVSDAAIRIAFLFQNPLAHPAVLIRRGLLEQYQLFYDAAYYPAEDYFMWFRLRDKTQFHNLDEVLLHYRLHDRQTSNLADHQGISGKSVQKHFVRESQLCDENVLHLFEKLIMERWKRTPDHLIAAGDLLYGMVVRNRQVRAFDDRLFTGKAGKVFWSKCYFATHKYCNGIKIFRQHPLGKLNKVPLNELFKAFLKTFLS